MAEQKWNKFRSTLNDVLEGRLDVARLVENSQRSSFLQRHAPKVSTVVQLDNEASDHFTIVEVSPRIASGSCSRSLMHCINSVCLSTSPRYRPTSIRWPIFSTLPTKMEKSFQSRIDWKRSAYPFTRF